MSRRFERCRISRRCQELMSSSLTRRNPAESRVYHKNTHRPIVWRAVAGVPVFGLTLFVVIPMRATALPGRVIFPRVRREKPIVSFLFKTHGTGPGVSADQVVVDEVLNDVSRAIQATGYGQLPDTHEPAGVCRRTPATAGDSAPSGAIHRDSAGDDLLKKPSE